MDLVAERVIFSADRAQPLTKIRFSDSDWPMLTNRRDRPERVVF